MRSWRVEMTRFDAADAARRARRAPVNRLREWEVAAPAPDPEACLLVAELRAAVAAWLAWLPERERLVIALRCGFGDNDEGYTQADIAAAMGVSSLRVAQIQLKALGRLARPARWGRLPELVPAAAAALARWREYAASLVVAEVVT